MQKSLEVEIKVGLFVLLGLALTMAAILVLGSADMLMSSKNKYSVHFDSVEGLIPGAKVVVGGIQIGTVDSANFDNDKHDIKVELGVARSETDWIRNDSTAEITTQGVLGDKFITIMPGSRDAPKLESGSEIPPRVGKDLTEFLSKGDQLMVSLNSIATALDRLVKGFEKNNRSEIFFDGLATASKNLASVTGNLNSQLEGGKIKAVAENLSAILQKINNGTGTLGALVNDIGLYDDLKSITGGANQSRVIRNLVRQTMKNSEKGDSSETVPKK